ncbi:hypothetical protein AAVH_30986, partial [Aphelenchoides avenae]
MGCCQTRPAKNRVDSVDDRDTPIKHAVLPSLAAAVQATPIYPSLSIPHRKEMEVKYDLTDEDKSILQSQWEATVLAQAPDIFMEAMLQSIKDSPKLLEVISCRMHDPSIQSLTEWPKLLNMIKGNRSFFSRQIETNR